MVVEEIIENMSNDENDANVNISKWREIKKTSQKIIAGFVGVVGLWTSCYLIQPESLGVVQRLGAYNRTSEPGLNFKIPFGIEKVTKVPVKTVQKEEFGFRTLRAGIDTQYLNNENIESASDEELSVIVKKLGLKLEENRSGLLNQISEILKSEYLMLTGDLNMADVEWIVQYDIKDPVAYLFNVKEPRNTIGDASQAVMRQLIGNGSIDEAITIGRIENEIGAKEGLQILLDQYNSGVRVGAVKLQSSNPPKRVREAFNEVNKTMQQKEEKINNAMQQYNQEVPRAKGEAQREIEEAEGYALERVNEANGNAEKFLKILEEYKKAPEITRQRLYLETMSELLPKIKDKIIVDDKGLSSGFYRMFNLDNTNVQGSQK